MGSGAEMDIRTKISCYASEHLNNTDTTSLQGGNIHYTIHTNNTFSSHSINSISLGTIWRAAVLTRLSWESN